MTSTNITALFGTMLALALVPGVSVLTVTARSAAFGFTHGAFTTAGIVTGDILFILLAILGLSLLAEAMGSLFIAVKYLAALYLLWLGISLLRSRPQEHRTVETADSSLLSSFLSGLLVTLGDQKAVLLYLGFFPAFIDLTALTPLDTTIIIVIAIIAVGGAKLFYAYMADKSRSLVTVKATRMIHVVAACTLFAVALVLVFTS